MRTFLNEICPGQCGSMVGASSRNRRGYGFDSWSGHISRLWVHPQSGRVLRQSMDASLALTFLSSLKKQMKISLGEDKKERKMKDRLVVARVTE